MAFMAGSTGKPFCPIELSSIYNLFHFFQFKVIRWLIDFSEGVPSAREVSIGYFLYLMNIPLNPPL